MNDDWIVWPSSYNSNTWLIQTLKSLIRISFIFEFINWNSFIYTHTHNFLNIPYNYCDYSYSYYYYHYLYKYSNFQFVRFFLVKKFHKMYRPSIEWKYVWKWKICRFISIIIIIINIIKPWLIFSKNPNFIVLFFYYGNKASNSK